MKRIFFLLLLLCMGSVIAVPPPSTEFYGQLTSYNLPVPLNSYLDAYVDGTYCGRFLIVTAGYFGFFTCRGDDPSTATVEGGSNDQQVIFKIGSEQAEVIAGNDTWTSGNFRWLNLTIPILSCGDGFCDAREACDVCIDDCGECIPSNGTFNDTNNTGNSSGNGTSNNTGNGTGGGGSGGGSGGGAGSGGGTGSGVGSGGAGSGGAGGAGGFGGLGGIFGQGLEGNCFEDWHCSNWSACMPDGFQTRACVDDNSCGSTVNKPPDNQSCVYIPTCFDSVQNGDETGVDCGGVCGPCPTCNDSIQNCHFVNGNKVCELGVDCGGPCKPCTHCFDGIQNDDEQGIDCGGSCEKACPFIRLPVLEFPELICQRTVNPFNIYLLIFLAVVLLGTLLRVYAYDVHLKKIRKNKKLSDVEKALQSFAVNRKRWFFITIITVVTIILLLYYYFFGLCPFSTYKYLWILAVLLLCSPLVVHRIMAWYEYNERKKQRQLGLLYDTHHEHLRQLINLQDQYLLDVEQKVQALLYSLSRDEQLQAHLAVYPDLKKIYRDLTDLYHKYKERETPYKLEKDLCDAIYTIETDKSFIALAEKYPKVKLLHEKLKAIYALYEEKQELYDEADAEQ
ncbi:MAG: hypothetical protein V1725_03590 [archaeon]